MANAADSGLMQVRNDFNEDPSWEGINNRIEAENPPTKKNDLGWRSSDEIGGIIWRSRTPAWYGMKVGPFSFDDALSASGTIRLVPGTNRDGGYIGFFNSTRQEWRPWSSMAFRVGDPKPGPDGALTSDFTLDYMSTGWKAGGYGVGRFPLDNKPHKWSWTYEPDVTIDQNNWPHPKLKEWLGDKRVPEGELLVRAKGTEPSMTMDALRALLEEAQYRGLIDFHTRRGVGWQLRDNPDEWKGRIVTVIEEQPRKTHFIHKSIREEGLVLDRFGIFNFQLPGGDNEFYVADLTVNGKEIDLSQDPGWEGKNNTLEFVEEDFHARQNYGYSKTNHAGDSPGEIGGTFWRTEPEDPLHGYYAGDIGKLTLDDPISFSGKIAFVQGATDAGMVFGYFNSKDKMKEIPPGDGQAGAPLPNAMHLAIEGPTRIGYYFSAQVWPAATRLASHSDGPIFVPDGKRHTFTFNYDPSANEGQGTVSFILDGKEWKHNLTKEQRQSGATFDKFGLVSIRRGGKYVEVYLDDLTYTARRDQNGQSREKHKQTVVRVPYPKGGRQY